MIPRCVTGLANDHLDAVKCRSAVIFPRSLESDASLEWQRLVLRAVERFEPTEVRVCITDRNVMHIDGDSLTLVMCVLDQLLVDDFFPENEMSVLIPMKIATKLNFLVVSALQAVSGCGISLARPEPSPVWNNMPGRVVRVAFNNAWQARLAFYALHRIVAESVVSDEVLENVRRRDVTPNKRRSAANKRVKQEYEQTIRIGNPEWLSLIANDGLTRLELETGVSIQIEVPRFGLDGGRTLRLRSTSALSVQIAAERLQSTFPNAPWRADNKLTMSSSDEDEESSSDDEDDMVW